MHQPIILCGLGRVGWSVLDYLRAAGLSVVVMDQNCRPDDPRMAGVRLVRGDCRQKDTLEQAGLAGARAVLILTSDDLINISTTLMIRSLDPEVRVVVRLFNQNLMARLGQAVKNVVALSVSGLTAPVLALTALTGAGLGTFRLEDGLRQVAEITAADLPHLVGQTIAEASARHRLTVLAHLPAQGPERFLREVDAGARLMPGDRLGVLGKPEDLLPHLRWAGWLRRTGRIIARTFTEIDLPVKIATGVLLVVIVTGTLIYRFGMGLSVPRGLFRTISLLATGAEMHEAELPEEWQKVFASLMRLSGAVLIATYTAIITNYLLRARLGKALELRRIPDGGHVVVCGLGNIGYEVVAELLRRGEQAVIIERVAENRFVATARRQGAVVIVGDATVLESLRQANAGSARAVIAATDNQLANVEIALLVRELNPRQRVVVGVADPYLAQVLRDAANVRLALSTSSLAAPAFVAALFGERVSNLFLIAGRALAIVELTVKADDPTLNGQLVQALSADYQLVPLGLRAGDQKPKSPPLDQHLAAGDTLTAIMGLPDLARLLRRERESGARSQESGVRSQESGARSQESEGRNQESISPTDRFLAPDP